MDFFETTIINCIIVIFPILLYFIYLIYNYNFNKDANELILDLCLITSYYLTYKFIGTDITSYSNFLVGIPLLLAYLKDRKLSIFILSIMPLIELDKDVYLIIMILEKIIFYILYLLLKNKEKYSMCFWFIKLLITVIFILNNDFNFVSLSKSLLIIVIGISLASLIISLFNKTDKIINIYMSLNDLKKESQIQESLFKITHEIKNPIAVCKGYLDMYDVENLDHSRRYIPILKSEIERTLILLQDFLCLRKIRINKEILDLTLLLDETIEEMSLYNDKKVKYIKKYDSEDEIYLNGDYNRLKQVLVNVIKNSIESINHCNGEIIIKIIKKNSKLMLIIKDNGSGMSDETIAKIKEPFYTTKQKGTGLGVPLSIEIIEAHNWIIDYSSKLEYGTTVEILIPNYEES